LQDIVDRPASAERLIGARGVAGECPDELAILSDDANVGPGDQQPHLARSCERRRRGGPGFGLAGSTLTIVQSLQLAHSSPAPVSSDPRGSSADRLSCPVLPARLGVPCRRG